MEVQDEMGSQEAQGPTVHQGHLVQQEIVGKMENRDHLVIQVHKEKEVSARNIARLMVVYSLKMVHADNSAFYMYNLIHLNRPGCLLLTHWLNKERLIIFFIHSFIMVFLSFKTNAKILHKMCEKRSSHYCVLAILSNSIYYLFN